MSTESDQAITEVNGNTIVRHVSHTTLAGEQRFSTTGASIDGLEATPRLSKGFPLIKKGAGDKTVYHQDTGLRGILENIPGEGQEVTQSPKTELPSAQGYLVDIDGKLKLDTNSNPILGDTPSFDRLHASGVQIDGERTPDWMGLDAPTSSKKEALGSARRSLISLKVTRSPVAYFTEGAALNISTLGITSGMSLQILPSGTDDDEMTLTGWQRSDTHAGRS